MHEFNPPTEYLISQSQTADLKWYWNMAYTKKTYGGDPVPTSGGGMIVPTYHVYVHLFNHPATKDLVLVYVVFTVGPGTFVPIIRTIIFCTTPPATKDFFQ